MDNLDLASAAAHFEQQGLLVRVPPIRSSDYDVALADPLRYFLTRRLGLRPFYKQSEALSRGSWFHLAFESMWAPDPSSFYEKKIEERREELTESLRAARVQDPTVFLQNEEKYAREAWAHYLASCQTRLPWLDDQTIIKKMKAPWMTPMVIDDDILLSEDGFQIVIRPDLLLHHEQQNSLWIVDPKTTALSTSLRSASCPIEFQTQHYMFTLEKLVNMGYFKGLPSDVRIGGMLHIIIKKPTIHFSQKDRPYSEYEHTYSRGKLKGQVEFRREYIGEPSWDLYEARCRDWYLGQGEYVANAEKWTDEGKPVAISTTSGSMLTDPWIRIMYHQRLRRLKDMASSSLHPDWYERPSSLGHRGSDPYGPFYLTTHEAWPSIVAREGFVQNWRFVDDESETEKEDA